MDNQIDLNLPPLGIGAFSTSKNVTQLLLVVEMMALVLLEGLSWYLAAFAIMLLHFWSGWKRVKQLIGETGMTVLPMAVEDEARVVSSSTPDEETVGWLNEIIEQFWERSLRPHVTPDLLNRKLRKIQRSFSASDPALSELVAKLKVVRLTLGNSPLVISRIEVDGGSKGVLGLSIGLAYHGNSELVLQVDKPQLYAIGRNLGFVMEVSVRVGPLPRDLSLPPTVRFSFLSQPQLMLEGGGLLALPVHLVQRLVDWVALPLLSWLAVQPRTALLQLPAPEGQHCPTLRRPAGLLRVLVIEARNLQAADQTFLQSCGIRRFGVGASDPYCEVWQGQRWAISPVVKKTLDPKWNFYCDFPILQPGIVGAQVVVKVKDWDFGPMVDDPLGMTSVDLANLGMHGEVADGWMDLNTTEVNRGQIRLKLQWLPCVSPRWKSGLEISQNSELCPSAIIAILVRSVNTSSMVEPLLCFQVTGGQFMSTSKGTYSTSTDFEQQLLLPVVNPSSDFVRLALYDLNEPRGASSKTRCARILGKISNALSSGDPKVVNPETTAREGAIAEEGPDVLYKEVGELQLPVRQLLHCKQVDVEEMLVPNAEVEARVVLSVRLHMLLSSKQKLKEDRG